MNADTDLLDLDEFTALFESGKLDHLTKKTKATPKKETAQKKPALRLADPLPSSIIPLVERIICKGCGAATEFLKSYGLKTVRRNHTSITAVTEANSKQFELLAEQGVFEAPIISEQTFQNCCKCATHNWTETND